MTASYIGQITYQYNAINMNLAWSLLLTQKIKIYCSLSIQKGITMVSTTISCIQCDTDFEFSAKDQEKYERKGFDPPRRCPLCRKHKSGNSKYEEKRKHKDKKKHFRMQYDMD
jgi:hypothetical protein